MKYPNFKSKHLEKALMTSERFVNWRTYFKSKKVKNPEKYIFIYYPYLLNYFKKKYKPKRVFVYRLLTIYQYKNIGVVMFTGVGSPNSAMIMEEIIALGGKEFINIGSAGGLNDFGIFLCDKAIRDEGTSYHYLKDSKYSYPDKGLSNRFARYLKKHKIDFETGTSWTIDAFYRETIKEIKQYKKEGVKTVEMEASALFAVANVRKVKITSAFVVSDILGEDKWNPQFNARHVKNKLKKLLDVSVDCLSKN